MSLDTTEGVMVPTPGPDIGLLYLAPQAFADFVLRLQFRIDGLDDNSGVFVRFRDPRLPGSVTHLWAANPTRVGDTLARRRALKTKPGPAVSNPRISG